MAMPAAGMAMPAAGILMPALGGSHFSLGTRAGTCPCTRVRTSARFAHPSAQRAHRAKIITCTPERLASHSTVLGNNFHNVIARTQCAAPHESIMKHYLHLKGPGEKSLCLWCHTLHDSLTGKAKVYAFFFNNSIYFSVISCACSHDFGSSIGS